MAKQGADKEKVVTPALGAEGATDLEKEALKLDQSNGAPSENKEELDTQNPEETGTDEGLEDDEFEAPEWAVAILESNQAVIDSNQEVIAAIDKFKEGASEVIEELVAHYQEGNVTHVPKEKGQSKPDVKLNKKAIYIVKAGKKFADANNPIHVFTEGDDVSKLEEDRLLNLLSQGIIEESKE